MNLKCKLVKKTFTDKEGNSREYHALVFDLPNNETLEVTIKKDKAQLLMLSNNVSFPDKPFWSKDETNSLKD